MSNRSKAATELELIEWHRADLLRRQNVIQPAKEHSAPFIENRVAVSVTETAVLLGVSVRTVERMIQRKELRVRRLGRRVLIPRQELGAWLNQKE